MRIPNFYREKENVLRQTIVEKLQRGKIDLNLYCEVTELEKVLRINEKLIIGYLNQLKSIGAETQIEGDYLSAVMHLPDVLQLVEDEVDEEEWRVIREALDNTIDQLNRVP